MSETWPEDKKLEIRGIIQQLRGELDHLVNRYCRERYYIVGFDSFTPAMARIVFLVCVESDAMRDSLKASHSLKAEFEEKARKSWPGLEGNCLFFDFESQETVDREAKGSCVNYLKNE